jgi:hypothetical protein
MQRTTYAGTLTDLRGRRDAFTTALRWEGSRVRERGQLEVAWRRALAREALRDACRAHETRRAHLEPVDEYVDFAFEVFAGAGELRAFRALRRRRWAERRGGHLTPLLATPRPVLTVEDKLRWRRWRRSGE